MERMARVAGISHSMQAAAMRERRERGRCVRALGAVARVAAVIVLALAGMILRPADAAALSYGSITIDAVYGQGEAAQPVSGDTWRLALVATATPLDDGSFAYTTTDGFAPLDRDWVSLDASGWRAATRELGAYAQDHGLLTDGACVTDSDGRAVFRDVAPGLYVAVRTDVASANKALTCDAVLVSVPLLEDGAWVYDVTVSPKFETSGDASGEEPQTPAAKPQEPESPLDRFLSALGIPATGGTLAVFALGVAATALLCLALARLLRTHVK